MKNNFLPIPDAPGYEINSQGLVRNIRTKKILKPYPRENRKLSVHIPKYNIRRTPESLRRQAVIFRVESGKNTTWEEIPNFGGLYEINSQGVVRNKKTKHIKKTRTLNGSECVMLCKNNKSVNRGIKSLLWEVHGKIFKKQHPRICSVKIIKEKEIYRFKFQKDCAIFLCKREKISFGHIRKLLGKRVENFHGWKIFYTESE